MRFGTLWKLGIGVAVGSLLVVGCGGEKKSEQTAPAEPAASAPVPPQEPVKMLPDAPWGTELPADFPEDIPRYPGAQVVKARPDGNMGWSVGFSSADEPAKVAAYFADALAAQGWSTQRVDAPEGIMIFADKGDRSATYGVGAAGGKTNIDLLVIEMR